jgi:hypothetical protein
LDQQFEQEALLLMATLLGSGHIHLRPGSPYGLYRLTIDSFKHLPTIIAYFSRHPLKTHKKDSFDRWHRIYSKMLNKEHLRQPGFNEIKGLRPELVNSHSDPN